MNKLHPKIIWIFFLNNTFLFVFLPLSFIIPAFATTSAWDNFPSTIVITIAIVIFILIVCLSYILSKLMYKNWKYQLTDTTLKIEKGVIWKKYISIPYNRIQNVDIYRGVLARLLGISEVHVQTAGYSNYNWQGIHSEGRLPGLDINVAQELSDKLIAKIGKEKQGL